MLILVEMVATCPHHWKCFWNLGSLAEANTRTSDDSENNRNLYDGTRDAILRCMRKAEKESSGKGHRGSLIEEHREQVEERKTERCCWEVVGCHEGKTRAALDQK